MLKREALVRGNFTASSMFSLGYFGLPRVFLVLLIQSKLRQY